MEALGTLAGGITHDFNNILGAIVINTELALLDLDPSDPARRPLPVVLQAANRGKELVKQIITFSRQRAWERKPVEIAPVVREGLGLLRSTLPKDIVLRETIDDGSGIVLAFCPMKDMRAALGYIRCISGAPRSGPFNL